ncbi:hypothetical protein B0H21DRAFT_894114 [Amylocystis lapponica]|nr:hypothetical protein B0H21DRAFT_894114 [Amylocystis lapponica]
MAPIDPNALRVFITGFGPFAEYQVNPSWLSVKPLHDSVLPVDLAVNARPIHITTHLLPTSYSSILASMPGFHAAPPFIPPVEDPTLVTPTPPADGYDFILHVGVTHRGPLRIESVGHKTGYNKPDVMQALAPVVHGATGDVRGFDTGYDVFPEDLCTDINVEGLVAFLRAEGIQTVNLEEGWTPPSRRISSL